MGAGRRWWSTHLGEDDGDDGLGVDEAGIAEVVEATIGKDLGARLEPDGLTELGGAGQQLGGDAAQSSKHGPAGMDHLQLAVPPEGLRVCGQTGRVPAVVCRSAQWQVQCAAQYSSVLHNTAVPNAQWLPPGNSPLR
jgi:hypothetical protein